MEEHAVVAFLDGDGSCDPGDLAGLVGALEASDIVLGRRDGPLIESGALPWHARQGNALVAAILRRRAGRPVHDLAPYKVLRRTALAALDLDDAGFGWTVQLVARSLMAPSLRVVEHPIAFRARRGGTSKVSGSIPASAAAARRMVGNAIRETADRPVVALVAKPPRAGVAKTRLAADIGAPAAIAFWRACLADLGASVRASAREAGVRTLAVVPAEADREVVAAELGPGWEVIAQQRFGLAGAITDAALAAAGRRAPAVLVIGGDHPTLPWSRIEAALAALRTAPAVLGPASDGGYYLIGLDVSRTPNAGVRLERALAAADLGTDGALAATARGLRQEGLAPAMIAEWSDVDVAADLAGLLATIAAGSPADAPATRAWLERYASVAGAADSRAARAS
jgi:glycosyltransferase A (GT-A) superfamily protein (DUF2064 family)